MSRRRKKQPAPAPRPAVKEPSGTTLFLHLLPLMLCLLPAVFFFTWGKYLEFHQPDPFDSGAYAYSAQHLLEGARLGVEEIPSAQPGTLLVNVIGVGLLGFSDTGPKVIQTLLQIGALAAMFFASRRLLGRIAAVLSVTIASIYLSAPHIAKFGNVKEQYMIAFMVMAVSFWIFYELTGKKRWLLLTGAALIWPYYFKATGLTVDIALAVYFVGRAALTKISLKQFQRELLLLIAGALIGIVPLLVFFAWQRQPEALFGSFPILMLEAIVMLDLAGIGLVYLRKSHPVAHLRGWCRQVRPGFWIAGVILILLAAGFSSILISLEPREEEVTYLDDLGSYFRNLFFVRIYYRITTPIVSFYHTILRASGTASDYISGSREVYSLSKQAPIVLRYYGSLSLPVAAGLLSCVLGAGVTAVRKLKKQPLRAQDRLVWLLMMWWILDMAFVWISPRSYEQYYLPLCASGAMLGGYAVWLFACRLEKSDFKYPYLLGAAAGIGVMIWMAWPIVFGLKKSTFSGQEYKDPRTGQPERRRGYVQALVQVRGEQGAWERIGEYIREHTDKTERIYVWGWYPGIYVQAGRLAPVAKAFEGDMHTRPPRDLASQVYRLVQGFEANPPAYIVDTRKSHFPWDRPPLELWPILQKQPALTDSRGYLLDRPEAVEAFEKGYAGLLRERIGQDEAGRFEAMKPLRDFVMEHYRVVPEWSYPRSPHVLLKRK